MNAVEESILTSVLQAEGEPMPPFVLRLLESWDADSIATATVTASASGKIATLTDISRLTPSCEKARLSSLYNGHGLPIALAEIDAETLVEKKDTEHRAERLASLANQAIESPESAESIRAELQEILAPKKQKIDDENDLKSLVNEGINRWEELHNKRGQTGVMTGFSKFDRATGGLKPGQMTVVAAETGGGKSTFALNIVNHAITNGRGVLLVTLEMDRHEIVDLLFAMNCRVNRNGFNTGNFEQAHMQNMVVQSGRISRLPLFIDDRSAITSGDITAKIRSLGGQIDLVIVDYLQIVEAADTKDSREQQIAAIAQALSKAAKESRVPMIALSQLNEEGKLRESRVIGHASCNVITLKVDGRSMKCNIVKGRFIPKFTFALDYEPEFCILRDERIMPNYDND